MACDIYEIGGMCRGEVVAGRKTTGPTGSRSSRLEHNTRFSARLPKSIGGTRPGVELFLQDSVDKGLTKKDPSLKGVTANSSGSPYNTGRNAATGTPTGPWAIILRIQKMGTMPAIASV